MKYLAVRNISDTELVNILKQDGTNVFIPDSYDTPISRLRKGCPVWIQREGEGTCEIYEIEGTATDGETEILKFLTQYQ